MRDPEFTTIVVEMKDKLCQLSRFKINRYKDYIFIYIISRFHNMYIYFHCIFAFQHIPFVFIQKNSFLVIQPTNLHNMKCFMNNIVHTVIRGDESLHNSRIGQIFSLQSDCQAVPMHFHADQVTGPLHWASRLLDAKRRT